MRHVLLPENSADGSDSLTHRSRRSSAAEEQPGPIDNEDEAGWHAWTPTSIATICALNYLPKKEKSHQLPLSEPVGQHLCCHAVDLFAEPRVADRFPDGSPACVIRRRGVITVRVSELMRRRLARRGRDVRRQGMRARSGRSPRLSRRRVRTVSPSATSTAVGAGRNPEAPQPGWRVQTMRLSARLPFVTRFLPLPLIAVRTPPRAAIDREVCPEVTPVSPTARGTQPLR